MPTAPTWSTKIWPHTRTGGRGSWRVPPSRGTWTGERQAPLSQKWKRKQRVSSEGQTLRTGGTESGPESEASWGTFCFFFSSTCCRGFLWDWLVAYRLSYRVRASATRSKPSSASSSGRSVWSSSGHRWWMLSTSASLVEGKKDVCTVNADVWISFLIISNSTSHLSRRKSWLVPTQYLLGLFMLYLSMSVNSMLQSEGGPKIVTLTGVFFMLAFLAATQVDARQHCDMKTHSGSEVLQWLYLLFPSGHSCWWMGSDHVIQGECGLCFYMQLCGPDSWLLPRECAFSGSGVCRLLQQIPQNRAQGHGHCHPVRYPHSLREEQVEKITVLWCFTTEL